MAYEIGTASDHQDLWDKLIAFLTTNEELVYDGQNWEIVWGGESDDLPNELVLKGPGLALQDEVFVGMRMTSVVATDDAEIRLVGMTGVIPSALTYNSHQHTTPAAVRMFMRTQPMDYWFTASGRRFAVVVQIGTVYECLYAGLFLPYADPLQYPYPLFIGGSAGQGGPNQASGWRSTAEDHAVYPLAAYNSSSTGHNPSAWLLDPAGNWMRCAANTTDANVYLGPDLFGTAAFGLSKNGAVSTYGYAEIKNRMIQTLGEGFPLTPITLMQQFPSDQTLGILDGIYHVPGRGNAIENEITADGKIFTVFQDTFRTSLRSWWAMETGVVVPESDSE